MMIAIHRFLNIYSIDFLKKLYARLKKLSRRIFGSVAGVHKTDFIIIEN